MTRTWLRYWSVTTLAGTFAMLALGVLVTSFKAGMADNTWPRTPWHLFTIEWQNSGLFVEHLHRFIGYTLGGLMIVLSFALWSGEPRGGVRWVGRLALVGVLTAAALAMWLLRSKQPTGPAFGLDDPAVETDGPLLRPAVLALAGTGLAGVLTAIVATWRSGASGRWARVTGTLLLVAVIGQGLLGGLRVKWNALYGDDLAAIHGAFSQIVLGLMVLTTLLTCSPPNGPDTRRMHAESTTRLDRWGLGCVILMYAQVLAGVLLRHSASSIGWLGPRVHLLFAFPAAMAIAVTCWRLRHTAAPRGLRWLALFMLTLLAVQLLLGVESWLARFVNGFAASAWLPLNEFDALLRSAHALVGYALLAGSVALAWATCQPSAVSRPARLVSAEGVA